MFAAVTHGVFDALEEAPKTREALAAELKTMLAGELPKDWAGGLPHFDADGKGTASRDSGGKAETWFNVSNSSRLSFKSTAAKLSTSCSWVRAPMMTDVTGSLCNSQEIATRATETL